MSSQIPLSPRTLEYLQGLPAHERAQHLLTGLAADGPLDASSAYSAEIATLAHFLWLAWIRGWTQGILAGRKGYEARELLGHRARSARTKASDLYTWGLAVLTGLGVRSDAISGADAIWWRRVCSASDAAMGQDLGASAWLTVRSAKGTAEALEAVGFLIDWQAQFRDAEAAA